MKRIIAAAFMFCGLVQWAQGQVSVYGFYNDYSSPENPLVLGQFEAISGEWLELDTLDFASAVVLGSSAFDAGTESYMFAGIGVPIETAGMGFWNYSVVENEILDSPTFYETINGIQHDMSADRLFALGTYAIDSTFIDFGGGWGYWEYEWGSQLVELHVDSGSVEPIVPVEDINGVILGATAFDSDNGIYALVGMDNSYNQKFIQLDVNNGTVVSSVNLQIPPNWGFNELECFINGDSYIGIKRPYGNPDNPPTTPAALVSVNPQTGMLTTLVELPQIYAFTPNASVFEQTTGLFIMLYYDSNYQTHMLVIDPVAEAVIADHSIEGSFIELQINNREFMVAAYGEPTAVWNDVPTPSSTIACSPNPASDQVAIASAEPFRILTASGRVQSDWSQKASLDVSQWPAGIYVIQTRDGMARPLVVSH